jgi:hypothetical protein
MRTLKRRLKEERKSKEGRD